MSDAEDRSQGNTPRAERDPNSAESPEEQVTTPFDHPFFLPILLVGLMLWFGYDGFLNTDPDMLEHVTFNRVGFGVLLVGAIRYGIKGYQEWKEERE